LSGGQTRGELRTGEIRGERSGDQIRGERSKAESRRNQQSQGLNSKDTPPRIAVEERITVEDKTRDTTD
jgi:hypothetical protein